MSSSPPSKFRSFGLTLVVAMIAAPLAVLASPSSALADK